MKASQFRFIVWDNEDKKFIKAVQEDRIPTRNTKNGFRLKSRFELFLTTGFFDSNNKEIYDGHILRVYHKWSLNKKSGNFFEVQFTNGRFKFGAPMNPKELFEKAFQNWEKLDLKYEIIGHLKNYKKQ